MGVLHLPRGRHEPQRHTYHAPGTAEGARIDLCRCPRQENPAAGLHGCYNWLWTRAAVNLALPRVKSRNGLCQWVF